MGEAEASRVPSITPLSEGQRKRKNKEGGYTYRERNGGIEKEF